MKRISDRTPIDQLRAEYDFSKLTPANRSKYPRYVLSGKVSSKGQITLPAEIMKTMGLVPGAEVTFEITRSGALIRKGRVLSNPRRAFVKPPAK